VKFTITHHSGYPAPIDALDLLWQRLEEHPHGALFSSNEVTFAKVGAEIFATWGEDSPVSLTQDDRVEIGRKAVLDIVCSICDQAPGLNSDWFAVGVKP
jgi:hypothetical protein